jgi:hypothetical protein
MTWVQDIDVFKGRSKRRISDNIPIRLAYRNEVENPSKQFTNTPPHYSENSLFLRPTSVLKICLGVSCPAIPNRHKDDPKSHTDAQTSSPHNMAAILVATMIRLITTQSSEQKWKSNCPHNTQTIYNKHTEVPICWYR